MTFLSRTSTKFLSFALAILISPVAAQTFSSGSTGVDGALNLTTPGTIVFDPKSFTPALDADGDGIYNFTTINIAAGVTVRLSGAVIGPPIVWLAQGAVTIAGVIDGSGQTGFLATDTTQRTLTIPGSGGYGGGYPAIGTNPAGAGLGPAGAGLCQNNTAWGQPGGFTGNQFLVPLFGGSGGGGDGPGAGGAGGGAILIASSSSISGSGSIKVHGGDGVRLPNGTWSGAGGGGAIRLVAPSVTISGNLDVSQGSMDSPQCGPAAGTRSGVLRVEAFQIGPLNTSGSLLYTGTPYGLFLSPNGTPTIMVESIGGSAVTASPTGLFTVPDVVVNSNGALPVLIRAKNVPLGTVVTLSIFSENGPDQNIQSTPLAGSAADSTATASVTLPSGFSKGFVKATFTQ